MGNDPVAEAMHQTVSEEVPEKLREIFAWLEKDAQDQFRDLDHFEEMLESITKGFLRTSTLLLHLSVAWRSIMRP
jgi:5'-deoxynucleotidase YfbR-like HD superfamily hydrolase